MGHSLKIVSAAVLSLLSLFLLAAAGFAADETVFAGLDARVYSPGENITISGTVYSGSGTAPATATVNTNGTDIAVDILGDGTFGTSDTLAPDATGSYNATISAGDASINIPFRVSDIEEMIVEIANETVIVPLSVSGEWANATDYDILGTTHNISVLNSSEDFDTVFADGIYSYLGEGDNVKLSDKDFTIVKILEDGSALYLAERLGPVFDGGETINLFIIALDSDGAPVVGEALSGAIYDDAGNLLGSGDAGATDGNGTLSGPFEISSDAGLYHIIINDMGHVSYLSQVYELVVQLKSPEGDSLYLVAPGQDMIIKIAALNSTTGEPIAEDIPTSIEITTPLGPCEAIEGADCPDDITLVGGVFEESIIAPDIAGKWSIEITADYSGQVMTAYIEFEVAGGGGLELFMFPVATQKGPTEGFAPGQNSTLFVGGRYLGTGEFANLSELTDNCANTSINLSGIFGDTGTNYLVPPVNNSNMSAYFTAHSEIPDFVQDDIEGHFGSGACVLEFIAPSENGVYDVQVDVNISSLNLTKELHSALSVQDIFIGAYPVSADGNFQWAFAPGDTVYLAIDGYDPVDGTPLSSAQILDASLIEVMTEDGQLVTGDMLNPGFATLPTGQKAINFTLNDSVMGFHMVRFRVTVNVSRSGSWVSRSAIGHGWFQERLYQVYVHPSEGRWSFGSSETVEMDVEVYDSSGMNGQEGVTVTPAEIIKPETRETIAFDSQACTTDTNGTCTLEINASDGTWGSGGHELRVEIEDDEGNEDEGHGWFEIRNFFFWAWVQNWEVSTAQDINITVEIRDFNNNDLNLNVTIEKLLYEGTMDRWQSPTVVNDSIGVTTEINGSGTITLPSAAVPREGIYSAVLSAVSGGQTEEARAWFYARPFVIWAEKSDFETNWERKFGTTDLANITVKGFESIDQWNWPFPNGTAHNLSAAWVKQVMKDGSWGSAFKTKEEMNSSNNMSSVCDGNTCYLTFNLTGFDTGNYMAEIRANDTASGAKASTWFWFRVVLLDIAVPNLIEWKMALDTNTMRNSTSFTLTDGCGGDSDTPIEPTGVTNCKYDDVQVVLWLNMSTQYPRTHFLLDKPNSRLFINATAGDDTSSGVNFSAVPNATVGETFTDAAGNIWRVSSIDNESNIIFVESTSGVIGTPWPNQDIEYDSVLFTINQTLSKSGEFLRADNLWDEEFDIDLDDDPATYMQNGTTFVVLADVNTANVYDTALLARNFNFTNYVDGSGPINFSASADPIYLLNIKYTSGSAGGANYYNLVFTTNEPGWPGRRLGVFPAGSIVKVPIIVRHPNGTAIAGATVNITEVAKFGGFEGFVRDATKNASATTNSAGVAILELNSSGTTSGTYFAVVKAQNPANPAQWVGTGMTWDNPVFEIRNFEVRGMLGKYAEISVDEWSEAAGNLQALSSDRFGLSDTVFMNCDNALGNCGAPEIWSVWEWEYNSIWYNDTENAIYIDQTPDDNDLSDSSAGPYTPGVNVTPLVSHNGAKYPVNFTQITIPPYNFTVNVSATDSHRGFTITVHDASDVDNTTNITVIWADRNWPVVQEQVFNEGDPISFGFLTVAAVTDDNVTFTWNYPAATFEATLPLSVSDLEGWEKRVKIVPVDSDYELVIYNNASRQTASDINGGYDLVDTILLINKSSGTVLSGALRVGAAISELGDKVVAYARVWDDKILLSNATIDGATIELAPEGCDAKVYYYGTVDEATIDYDINGDMDRSDTYYLLTRDTLCDGADAATEAWLDDDRRMHDVWVDLGGGYEPWDYDMAEKGSADTKKLWEPYNFREEYISIGGFSWPISIISLDVSSPGIAELFAEKQWVEQSENLTVYIRANNFDGTVLNGNATIDSVEGFVYGCKGGPGKQTLNITGAVNLTDGVAMLLLDLSTAQGGDYMAKILVTDNSTMKQEKLEQHIWVQGGVGSKMECEGTAEGPR